MQKETINIALIDTNEGQVAGLKKNPRFIKDHRYAALVKSLRDLPSMMDLRELIVFPQDGRYVAIGGNMRLRACRELEWQEVPCKVLSPATPAAELREIAMKDNTAFGSDDFAALNAEWDIEELKGWGVEMPELSIIEEAGAADENLKHEKQIRLKYSEKDYLIVKEQLAKHADTPEQAVWKLLGNK